MELIKSKQGRWRTNLQKLKKKDMPKSWEENLTAGVDWMKGFRRRAKNLTLQKVESISLSRAMSFNCTNVVNFLKIKNAIQSVEFNSRKNMEPGKNGCKDCNKFWPIFN